MVMVKHGHLVFSTRGGPTLAFHWSLAFGVIALGRPSPSLGFIIGYVLIVACHNWGHARRVRSCGHRVARVSVNALGGRCLFAGVTSARQSRFIACGGVVAQAALLGVAVILDVCWPSLAGPWGALLETLTLTNAVLIAINLLPVPGADGYEFWAVAQRKRALRSPRRERIHGHPPRHDHDHDAKVLVFPRHRTGKTGSVQRGDAAETVAAQIIEIAERVNEDRKRGPSDDSR